MSRFTPNNAQSCPQVLCIDRTPYLAVAIDTPLRQVFDYRAPEGAAVGAGFRVWVPFGRRRVVGVVVEGIDQTEVPANKLRAAFEAIDAEPTLDPGLLSLLTWAAEYYRHPVGEVLTSALPVLLRNGAPVREEKFLWRLTELGREKALATLPARSVRLRAIAQYLTKQEQAPASEILSATESPSSALRNLEARGFVEEFAREKTDIVPPVSIVRAGPPLNEAQTAAVERIRNTLDFFASHLLYGVTGSGKTEVYLHVIEAVLARGQQVLVLVPEIALTPQLISRFRARFDAPLAVLHSGLNDTERLAAWRDAREGTARIVIGTRSAIFTPLLHPGLIIIDEEHDASFKQQDGFRYSARDLSLVRAQRLGIPVVLGSATPSLETLARARKQPETLSLLSQRAGSARPPQLALVDLRKHGATQGIATPTVMTIRRHLDAGGQVMLFINRRGYAPVLFCPNCGWSAHCRRCDAHLTVHARGRDLICHHCGSQEPMPPGCSNCFADVKPVGQGTERIEEALQQLFPGAPMARIDRDSMRRKGELEETLARVNRGEIRILVGTQMLTKGHDFPQVTLVVVLNADQGLFSTDFRASERLAQTIVQVAGRAGRADRPGEVLIQTEYPEHPLLTLLLTGGYAAFADGALTEREQSGWPPFARIALLRAEATDQDAPLKFLQDAHDLAVDFPVRGVQLLGPAPAPMERRAGRFRAQLMIRAPSHSPLQKFLSGWLPILAMLPEARRVRWSIDVDAAELS
nr:primosomal protein N' [Steroidobacter agaridevorans]